jgi:Caspase domain
MEKFALLIGVSEYEPHLTPLPTAIKDTEALREVLLHPEIGGFASANVEILHNPSHLDMGVAIHTLFSNRQKDDLVLLFFSGHGVTDAKGKFYLSTRETRRTQAGELITPTSIAASFIDEQMSNSRSKRQVVILDSCFSAAFSRGMGVKDDRKVDIQAQLGGKGRAVLTSSDFTEYSLYQAGEELSIYTRYLVEGIRTGAADANDDGYISIAELHEYAKNKVIEVTSNKMNPKIFYIAEEGHWIHIATTLTGASKLKFQKAELLKQEFNKWLDIVFKYEAEKRREELFSALSKKLAFRLLQDCFKPCLEKWRTRSTGYITVADVENKAFYQSKQWLEGDVSKKLVIEGINEWVNLLLDALSGDILAMVQKYSLNSSENKNFVSNVISEVHISELEAYKLEKSPTLAQLFKIIAREIRNSIQNTILSILAGILLILAFIVPPPSLWGLIFAGALSLSHSLGNRLENMLSKDLTPLRNTDLPKWIRKKVGDRELADQMQLAESELRGKFRAVFSQDPTLATLILEEIVPSIKKSFEKKVDESL